jgi:hypothetical protein
MAHEPGHEQTIEELLSGVGADPTGGGGTDLRDRIAQITAGVIASADAADANDPFLGGVGEDFESTAGFRPTDSSEARAARDPRLGGTPATFRSSDLERIAQWPIEKRSRLLLQMQKAGIVSPNVSPRFWTSEVTDALSGALSFANINGITDPFQAVATFGAQKAAAEDQAKPDFNFVGRDFLPPDSATVDEDIRGLAKKMFAGTDIELSDDEVASLRGQFEGLLREQHFAEEQQRLSNEFTAFEANAAAAEGRPFHGTVDAVPQVDAAARFRNVFEERFQPELDAIDRINADDENRELTGSALSRVIQFATGRS